LKKGLSTMRKLTSGILLGLAAMMSAAQAENRFHPNHLFVKMKPGQTLVESSLIKSSKKITDQIFLVKTNNVNALASEVKGLDSVEYIQKDYYSGKSAMPKHEVLEPIDYEIKKMMNFDFFSFNDPQMSKLWAFSDKGGMDVAGAYNNLPNHAPAITIVAVVDTGVDHNHEDLKDIMWTNPGEIAGDGIDNDGNGYIDDIHGINVLVRTSSGQATVNTMGSHWHGTHVAGTIAATQNNHIGIAGVASHVRIMAIRTVPDNSDELDSNIVEAYQYAARNGARILNCSFGKDKNEGGMVVRDVINEIGKKHGVLVVASAGNDSSGPFSWHNNDTSPKYPAAFDSENLLVIASTTSSGSLSSFSNIGKMTVDLAAPGSNIFSTIIGNKYGMASGTSMASPNTVGVAAMVLSYYPQLSGVQLKKVLMDSVTKVPDFASKMASGGRVNLKNALQLAGNRMRIRH
jgi:thermitase